jgi:hypothetical protein
VTLTSDRTERGGGEAILARDTSRPPQPRPRDHSLIKLVLLFLLLFLGGASQVAAPPQQQGICMCRHVSASHQLIVPTTCGTHTGHLVSEPGPSRSSRATRGRRKALGPERAVPSPAATNEANCGFIREGISNSNLAVYTSATRGRVGLFTRALREEG